MVKLAIIQEIEIEPCMKVCGDCRFVVHRPFEVTGSRGEEYVCDLFGSTLTWVREGEYLPSKWEVTRCARCRYAEEDARTIES